MSLAYRPDIDGLRAIAVGTIVLFHGGFSLFSGGFVGVDIFFVISGYLITSILAEDLERGRFSLADFYDRRIRRILPALFVVLAVTTVAASFFLLPSQMADYARSLRPAALFYANFHFMGEQSYFAPSAEEMPLLHLWSLAVEEQFYIVFPLLLFVLMRLGKRHLGGRRLALGVLLLVAGISLVHAQMELAEAPRRAFFLLSSRAWELLIGAFLALAPLPRARPGLAAALGGLGLAAVLVPVFVYDRATPFPGLAALPPVLGAALLIYSGRHAAGAPVARLLALAPFVYVGRISYSLYLWHWPLLSLAFVYRERAPTPLLAALLILLAGVLAALSLRFVEQPLRRSDLLGGRRALRFAAAAAGLLLVVLAGQGIGVLNGQLWPMSARGQVAEAVMNPSRRITVCETTPDFMKGTGSCVVKPPGGADAYEVLVWGDSHAHAAYQGFAELLAAEGVTSRLLTLSACPPLDGVITPRFDDEAPTCAAFNTAVMKEIARAKPKLVVLVSRWALWTTHAQRSVALVMPDLPAAREPSPEGSRAAFPVALRRTVEEIRKLGPKVLLVGQVPEYLSAPAKCVARAEYFGWAAKHCMTQSAEANARVVASSDTELERVAREVPGTRAILLTNLFCDAKECAAGTDTDFYYADGNHLAPAGAARLRDDPGVRAAIDALLGRSAHSNQARMEPRPTP